VVGTVAGLVNRGRQLLIVLRSVVEMGTQAMGARGARGVCLLLGLRGLLVWTWGHSALVYLLLSLWCLLRRPLMVVLGGLVSGALVVVYCQHFMSAARTHLLPA
jgi:hypothetical protein